MSLCAFPRWNLGHRLMQLLNYRRGRFLPHRPPLVRIVSLLLRWPIVFGVLVGRISVEQTDMEIDL